MPLNVNITTENAVMSSQESSSVRNMMRTKFSKIIVYKRPVSNGPSEFTTESMITISSTEVEGGVIAKLNEVMTFTIDVAAKLLLSWKTTLTVFLVILLILSLIYYRTRVNKLKAEIVKLNLGSSYSQSCSSTQSSNAYTPRYFSRRPIAIKHGESDEEASVKSRSDCYSHAYNASSCHTYESIEEVESEHDEHIYAEIPGSYDFIKDEYGKC